MGAARCNRKLLDGWTLMIWTKKENFILQALHLASVSLALWVLEKGHFRRHFQSGREMRGDRQAATPQAGCALCL